jgi:WD40 repeat protein
VSAASVDFNPDAERVAVARWDGTVTLWNLTSDERSVLGGPGHGPLLVTRFSPDGELLATGGSDSLVRLWRVRDRQERHTLRGHIDRVLGLDFSPDGRQLATVGRDKALRIWDVANGEPLDLEKGEVPLTGVRFAPDGLALAVTGEDGSLWLRDLRSRDVRLVAKHTARAYALDVSPSGEQLAVAYADHTARIWSLDSGQAIELVGHRAEVASIRFAPNGESVVTTSDDGTVRLWNARTGRPSWRAPLLTSSPPRLSSHRGWTRLDGESDGASWPPVAGWVQALETDARIADLFSAAEASLADTSTVRASAATAPTDVGDSHLCTVAGDGTLQLWDAARGGRVLASHPFGSVGRVVALPAGCLALADSRAVIMSNAGMLRELSDRATAVAVSDGEILVATTAALKVFSSAGVHLRDLPTVRGASAVLRIGERVLFGSDNGTLLLTAPTAEPGFYFANTPPSPVVRLLAGPMETVVAGYAGGDVGIWNLEDGSRLDVMRLHGAAIHLAIDGPRLIAASELGDHGVLDLGIYLGSHCELLAEVWDQVPVVWAAGRARLAPPPAQHPCTP